jgi:hypothetical protein
VVDYLESREYHGHAPHMKVVNPRVFQIPLMFNKDQLQIIVNLLREVFTTYMA